MPKLNGIRICVGLILGVFCLGGCGKNLALPWENPDLFQARQAAMAGEIDRAHVLFTRLADRRGVSGLEARQGLAGLAMIQAETPGAFSMALDGFLETLDSGTVSGEGGAVSGIYPGNRLLVIQALVRGNQLMASALKDATGRLQRRDRDLFQLNARIRLLEKQITTIETIDQEFQEKRKNQ
ncbi:MAG: hypothetical protein MI747_04195 [Desulfobacterales bacterium]|nr:hypothetical protein [Desulfobacterales bacterium]